MLWTFLNSATNLFPQKLSNRGDRTLNKFNRYFLVVLLTTVAQSAMADLVNGDFETGDLTGWTATNNGSAATIQVTSGDTSTGAGTISGSLTGDYYVFTSQSGPGSSFLSQPFTVQAGTKKIFFDIAIINAGGAYFLPDPMSFVYAGDPNQQARFDILIPGAALDTVDPADIIVTAYQTQPGDPLNQDWASYEVDATTELAPYIGQPVIFRFVQVDNQGFFNLAIDNVNVGLSASAGSSTAMPVPTMSVYGLVLTFLALLFVASRRLRKTRAE